MRFSGLLRSCLFTILLCCTLSLLPNTAVHAEVDKGIKKEIQTIKIDLRRDKNNVELLLKLAERYGWAEKQGAAIETYEKVLKIDPDNLKAMKSLKDFYSWTKQPDKAIAMMHKIIDLDPENTEMRKTLAKLLTWDDEQLKAIKVYEEVLEIDPDDLEVRRSLSDLYRWNKMPKKELKQYVEIMRLDPEDMKTKELLAFTYSWGDHPKKSIVLFEEILKKDPENAKVRKQLAHMYYYNQRQAEAVKEYDKLLGDIQTDAERIDVYKKMSSAYKSTKNYQKAIEYYQELLKLEPDNVDTQERLAEAKRKLNPQVFGQVDIFEAKGAETKVVQRYGFNQIIGNGFAMETQFLHERRTELGEERFQTYGGEIEISKDFENGFTLYGGGGLFFYGPNERGRVEYFLRGIKRLTEKITGYLGYRSRAEDSDFEKLHQKVDRHTLTGRLLYAVNKRFSLNGSVWGDYLTKGEAPSDNYGIGFSVSPILHIIFKPILDLSYTYYQVNYMRQDSSPGKVFEYFNPRLYYTHSGTLYFSHSMFNDRINLVLSDRLYYVKDVGDISYFANTIYAGIDIKFTEDDVVSVGLTRDRQIKNVQNSYQKVQQVTVRYSHDF